MNKPRSISIPTLSTCLAIILACIFAQSVPVYAANHSPPTRVMHLTQQDDKARPAQLGENRGEIPEGSSQFWTYEGQAGEVLTIKAEADKPTNDAEDRTGLLDMLLIVYAPDGTIIAKADDIQPGTVTDSVIEGLQLPTDGTYQIEVLGLEKKLSGAYTLTLQALNTISTQPTPTPDSDWPTLTIENQLEDTICYIYISPASVDALGDEWLGTKKVIFPHDKHQLQVGPDEYNIVASDCYGNTLDVNRQFDVTQSSTLTISPLDGPAAQCAEGDRLFHEGKPAEALPLLEVGFAGRESATFVNPDDEGLCALGLGFLRNNFGNYSGALDAFQVALKIFHANGHRGFEGIALNNIGKVYDNQGKYDEALAYYEQVLEIRRGEGDRAGEGPTLHNIGAVYHVQGKYDEALAYYEQALEIRRKVGDHAGEGNTLNNIGAVYEKKGKYDEALAYYEQALEIIRGAGDRVGEGTTLNNIGLVYYNKGKYDEALAYYEQALEIKRDANAGDRAGEGDTLNNIGLVYHNKGKYDEALAYYEQALEIRRGVGDRAGEGDTLNNIGVVYENKGKYDEALAYYEQALEIIRRVGDRAGEGDTLNNIASIYENRGKYDEALAYYEQALNIRRGVGDRATEGNMLNNIGAVYENNGKYDEALVYYEQALKITLEVGDRVGEGVTLNNIGVVYENQGKYNEALAYYEQALEIRRGVGYRVGEGNTLNNIGAVYHNKGKYDEALVYYEQALEIIRKVGNRELEGIALNNIGAVYDNQGRYDEALAYYEQALEIRRGVGYRVGEGTTLTNIGFAYEKQDQAEEALDYYEQAVKVFETIRATAGDDQERASFIAQYVFLYSNAIGLYHEQEQDKDAFLTSERGRARSFLDSLTTGKVQLSDKELQALIDEEGRAYEQRFTIRDQLIRARVQNPHDEELVAKLEAQLEEAEDAYSKALAAIEVQGDELAALMLGRSSISTLAEVQALLDEETTLLSYWVLGEEDGTLAFVITTDELTVVQLPDATPDNLDTALSDLYDWPSIDEPHPLPLRNLHRLLVEPLAEHIKTPKVGLIPHQALHQVPFAALTDGERYLGELYTLFRLPSASALSHIQKNAANLADATKPALVFGNPTTGEKGFGSLVYAGKEAVSVAQVLETSVYTKTSAHEARLWSDVVGAPVVHLAAHGSYNDANALYSAIHLAPQGDYDGRLETHEVYGLDLSAAEMVVLSACESNVGEISRNDDIVGLTRAFFFAGTPTLVASLWNVDDAATETLMSTFYRNWQSGMGKAEALQAAQAELRKTHPSPFYWTAFVLNGDPGEMSSTPIESASPKTPTEAEGIHAWWLIVAIVGLLGSVSFMIRRQYNENENKNL